MVCEWCGSTFRRHKSVSKLSDSTLCSQECFGEWKSMEFQGSKNPQWDGGITTVECGWCHEDIEQYPCHVRQNNFCDSECMGNWKSKNLTGVHSPRYSGGDIESECLNCSEVIYRNPYELEHSERHFCSNMCQGEWIHNNPNQNPHWNGGISINLYKTIRREFNDVSWSTTRNSVVNDNDVCKMCSTSEQTLQLHHIVPIMSGGMNGKWNYMKLCPTCHRNVEQYTSSFTERYLSYDYYHDESWEPQ